MKNNVLDERDMFTSCIPIPEINLYVRVKNDMLIVVYALFGLTTKKNAKKPLFCNQRAFWNIK